MDAANRSRQTIVDGKACLGIELGSTRIKAVLIGEDFSPIASGSHGWESCLENGSWTYHLEDIWQGLQAAYASLARNIKCKYGVEIRTLGALGISGMMHGYMPFDADGDLLTPFRTWRNTTTGSAADMLTSEFAFNIPQRWSIAHLYQAILNEESHVAHIDSLTTLSGYVHRRLTGENVLGIGEASGMFPVDSTNMVYDQRMITRFNKMLEDKRINWRLDDVLPEILTAGKNAGTLTEEGARLLDPTGFLEAGIPLCPPEGDAGTGMVATNAVAPRTGNVSAGTSVFAMIVLEKELSKAYPEIDMVTTPTGKPVAMVHCNNCTNEINAWASLFNEVMSSFGCDIDVDTLYTGLFTQALQGESDCGGLLLYNYLSGEPITGFVEGRPLFVRTPDSKFSLSNLMRAQLYSSVATLSIGMELLKEEHVHIDRLMGHGGFFKTAGVGRQVMAAATQTTVTTLNTASEGGPWGMALLSAYMLASEPGLTLEQFLDAHVFAGSKADDTLPCTQDVEGFKRFLSRYRQGLAVEKIAVENVKATVE